MSCDIYEKIFSCQPSELILSWLLRCWDIGTNNQELEGKEARQVGSLARDKAIDKGIGKRAGVLSLWWRLPLSVKDRSSRKILQIPEANGPPLREVSSI